MSWQESHEPCALVCPWNGTEMCVRHLLTIECMDEHHIGLAVTCGLKQIYHPHGLPPCVHAGGDLDWDPTHHSPEELLALN